VRDPSTTSARISSPEAGSTNVKNGEIPSIDAMGVMSTSAVHVTATDAPAAAKVVTVSSEI
jgi:hypothetical protein